MHTTIEIDFDVFKKLTVMRETEAVTYNDVLRRVLHLGVPSKAPTDQVPPEDKRLSELQGAWVTKNVPFPHGTEFRATHKGRIHYGKVEGGALVVDGKSYDSPSAAAVAITGTSVNGWVFWECRKSRDDVWRTMKAFRGGK